MEKVAGISRETVKGIISLDPEENSTKECLTILQGWVGLLNQVGLHKTGNQSMAVLCAYTRQQGRLSVQAS